MLGKDLKTHEEDRPWHQDVLPYFIIAFYFPERIFQEKFCKSITFICNFCIDVFIQNIQRRRSRDLSGI